MRKKMMKRKRSFKHHDENALELNKENAGLNPNSFE